MKINFYLNGKINENNQNQANFPSNPNKLLFNGVYRSKSPEVMRNQIFINSSKNALLNMDPCNMKIRDSDCDNMKNMNGNDHRFYNQNNIYQGLEI